MVSTRNHPSNFPPPDLSPTKSSSPSTPSTAPNTRSKRRPTKPKGWTHTPSHLTLAWLAISLPLVIWDTGYVLLRPYSMPGGSLHWPIWQPYGLYGTVDYIYGFPAWEASNGFTAAQAALNVVETVLYAGYLWVVARKGVEGRSEGRGAVRALGWLGAGREVGGREAGVAVLVGLCASVMTLSKTVLYWANEAFSGWHNIGHNDLFSLVFMWIIPNGAWLVLPTYMTYVFFAEILEGLTTESSKSTPLAIKDE